MRFRTILWRSLRLRCPACGGGKLFRGWFRMHAECSACGLRFEREPGYFLGSIYFNYGLTALLATAAFFALFLGARIPTDRLMWPVMGFCLVFPLWFFRYARSLWLGMDEYFDPRARPAGDAARGEESGAPPANNRRCADGACGASRGRPSRPGVRP